MAAIQALEQQLRFASSNNTALQRQQAQLMESVHTLIHMVTTATGLSHQELIWLEPNWTWSRSEKFFELQRLPRNILSFLVQCLFGSSLYSMYENTHKQQENCPCETFKEKFGKKTESCDCELLRISRVASTDPDVEGLCGCLQVQTLGQRSVLHLHQQQLWTCAGTTHTWTPPRPPPRLIPSSYRTKAKRMINWSH